jgi:hypothetical protein
MANIENWETIGNEAEDGSTLTNRELIDEFTTMSERDARRSTSTRGTSKSSASGTGSRCSRSRGATSPGTWRT